MYSLTPNFMKVLSVPSDIKRANGHIMLPTVQWLQLKPNPDPRQNL